MVLAKLLESGTNPGLPSDESVIYGGYRPGASVEKAIEYFAHQSFEPATTTHVLGGAYVTLDYIWY